MRGKHLILCILFSVTAVLTTAQPLLRINSECNPLVASLEEIAYVVRQDYALQGTDGVLYGQNNQDFFGYRYGAAIIWNGQLYISPTTYYAHLMDSNTHSYGKEYRPIPSKTYFKHLEDQSFTLIDSGSIKATPEKAYAAMPDSLSGFQAEEVMENSKRRVIVITYECKDREWSDTSQFRLSFMYSSIIVEANGKAHLPMKKIGNTAHFALVFEEITEVGTARLAFLGFAETIGDMAVVKMIKVEPTPENKDNGKHKRR